MREPRQRVTGTAEICREYAAKDARVRYHRNSTNLGVIKNFNRVFELSTGHYFMWAGDHDPLLGRSDIYGRAKSNGLCAHLPGH